MLLKDRVIIISGIGPGMGIKCAINAAKEGARGVVLSARRASRLEEAEEEVAALGTGIEILTVKNDIRDEAACHRLAAATVEKFGRIDGLVNNAFEHGPLDSVESAELDGWIGAYQTNVIGTMKMSRAVIPQMKKQGEGYIANVNTMGSRRTPIIPEAGYCASKAGLISASRSLAEEVGKYGIRVNSVHPGWMWGYTVENSLKQHAQSIFNMNYEEAVQHVSNEMALKRIVTDDEVSLATLFLVSKYASGITGVILDANGGNWMP